MAGLGSGRSVEEGDSESAAALLFEFCELLFEGGLALGARMIPTVVDNDSGYGWYGRC